MHTCNILLHIDKQYFYALSFLDEFPSTWGKYDKNPQIKVVPLDPKAKEYIDVKNGFDLTIGGSNRTIVKIERIQNPTLYAQYAARKKLMDQTNPPGTMNERRLYHGCGGDVVQNIIHGGFNRSYAGKNGTNITNVTSCLVCISNIAIQFTNHIL